MKKIFLLVSVAAAAAAVSCTKESADVQGQGNVLSFSASYPQVEEARTVLNSDKSVSWTAPESISVQNLTTTGAVFTNTAANPNIFSGIAPEQDTYYALSPASAVVSWKTDSDKLFYGRFIIPAEQVATKGSWDPKASILFGTASNTDKQFVFKHVTGYIKFTIGAASGSIKKVELTSGVSLAGDLEIRSTSNIKGTKVGEEYKSVVLATSDGNAMEQGDYYIVVRGRTYTGGITVKFTNTDNKVASVNIPEKIVSNGVVYNLGTVSGLDFDPVVSGTEVGDPYLKGDVKGAIFWVDPNNAKNVKIVSIKANGPMNFCTNAVAGGSTVNALSIPNTSKTDGAANMTAIANFMSTNSIAESEMLGYATCKAEGDGWYLPAIGELADLMLGYNLGLDFATSEANYKTAGSVPSQWVTNLTGKGANPDVIAAFKSAYEARVKMDGSLAKLKGDPICASETEDGTTYLSSTQHTTAAQVGYATSGSRLRTSNAAKYASKPSRFIRCIKAVTLD